VPLPGPAAVPLLLLKELDPQPDKNSSEQAPMTSERWPGSISVARLSKSYKVMPAVGSTELTASRNAARSDHHQT
jgi:hypothetical protein